MSAPAAAAGELSKLILGLTYACQSRCVHCSCALHPVSRTRELSLEELGTVIRDAARLQVKEINLFGGEPTLRKDFAAILDLASTWVDAVTIDTNGYRLTPELAALMRSRGVRRLYVSLAGSTAAAHDRIQRVRSFERVTRAIAAAVHAQVPTHVSICAFREHIANGELERTIELARSLGAQGARIALPMCSGKWLGTPDVLLTAEEAARVRALTRDPFVYLVEEESGGFLRCNAVSGGSFYVSPYGDVQPCNFIPLTFGSVREQPLELLLERMAGHRMFQGRFQDGSCPMHRPAFVAMLREGLADGSRLAVAPPPTALRVAVPCNNRCRGCRLRVKAPGDAPALLASVADLPDTFRRVLLHGGEPTLHPAVGKLIAGAARRGFSVALHTNARLFAYPEAAARIRRAGLAEARVPFFGADAAQFDAWTRTPGSAEQTERGIAHLARAGVRVEVLLPPVADARAEDDVLRRLVAAGAHRVIRTTPFAGDPPACGRAARDARPADALSAPVVLHSARWSEPAELRAWDVILVFPHNESADEKLQLPYSLLFLAAPLVAAGRAVKIIDQRISPDWREQLEAALRRSPGLACVGISCFISRQVAHALEVARVVRAAAPRVPLVWGGAFPSLLPEQVLRSGLADYVVRGEGERSFLALCRALRGEGGAPAEVAGVVSLAGGRPVAPAAGPPLVLDELPALPYELVPLPRYHACRSGIQWALYTSRGCPFACRFCAISLLAQRRWRAMGAPRVLDEFRRVVELGARDVAFCEDNFFVDPRRVRAIARGLVRARLPATWSASCRVDAILRLPPELLRLLHRSGLRHLHIGAESGSDRILALLDKKITRRDILAANRRCREHGIVPEFIFMAGFPTETKAERRQTIELIARLKRENPDAWFWRLNHYVPYPGTALYRDALARGFTPPADLAGWAEFGWHRSDLSDLVDYQVGF